MQTDVVTGAFGYSGVAIARELLAAGRGVRTLTGHPGRAPADSPIEVRPMDFADPAALERDLSGAHTLYCTYWIRFARGAATHDTAVAHLKVLFDAAARAGVQRIVHVSITHADSASKYPYFRGKGQVEEYLAAVGVPHAIVRPAILFGGNGVLLNNIAWLLRHLPAFAIGGDGAYRIRPIHVDDLARLCVSLGSDTGSDTGSGAGSGVGPGSGNVTVDAVGPESVAFRDMVAAIRSAVGSRSLLVPAPGWLIPPLSSALSVVLRDTLLTSEEYYAMAEGLADSTAPTAGEVSVTDWIAKHGDSLGRTYANELARHYQP
jgi:NADH dehydrogenase